MHKKMAGFLTILFILFSGLMVRVVYLSTSPDLTETAHAQSNYTVTLSDTRAEIYDRNFNSFVNNQTAYRAVVLPDMSCIDSLMELNSSLDREKLIEQIQLDKPFVVSVNEPTCDNPNIQIYPVNERYTENSLASHMIGYLNIDGEGVTGLEQSYNDFLNNNGQTLSVNCSVNGLGEYLVGDGLRLLSSGSSSAGVVTTLDCGIQDIIERVGSKMIPRGSIVVLDAQTAQILGSASFPSFSQNNPAASLNDTVNTPMVNRSLQAFHVGSTFKIATAAAALDSGISPELTYNCVGKIEVAGQTFRCHNRSGHGILNLQQALRDSCNPYFINLGLQTGADKIRNVASDIGFGRSYTLADGMVSMQGLLTPLEDLQNPGDIANFSFGQGELTGTPLQVSELLFSVCNHGQSISPTLVKGVTYDGNTIEDQTQIPAPMTCMSESTAAILKEDLALAISQQSSDALKPLKTTAGGKSATAQTGKVNENGEEIYQVWYTGFFPVQEPKYIVTVLMEGGTSGTESAGPVFAEIADLITEYEATQP